MTYEEVENHCFTANEAQSQINCTERKAIFFCKIYLMLPFISQLKLEKSCHNNYFVKVPG